MRIPLTCAVVVLTCACSTAPDGSVSQTNASATASATTSATTRSYTPPPAALLQVQHKYQDAFNWCWAAASEMVMSFVRSSPEQCQQANDIFSTGGCCPIPTQIWCDKASVPSFSNYNFHVISVKGLSEAQLAEEVGLKQRPVVFRIDYDEDNRVNHFLVAYGYYSDQGIFKVWIHDPVKTAGNQGGAIPYLNLVRGWKGARITEVFYEIY